MQVNLTMLQQIAAETHRENITLARIARQGQDDAKRSKDVDVDRNYISSSVLGGNDLQLQPDSMASRYEHQR